MSRGSRCFPSGYQGCRRWEDSELTGGTRAVLHTILVSIRITPSDLWYNLGQQANLGLRKVGGVCKLSILRDAPVAQLDRAFDYESKGRTFESCRAHHHNQ